MYVYYTHQHTHSRTHTHTHSRKHTHITHNRTLINTSMSVCTYSYTRSLLYISVDCWTYPILYHSPEQLTICIFPVFCCLLFFLFCSISFIKNILLHTILKYGGNKDIVLYCIVPNLISLLTTYTDLKHLYMYTS